MFFAIELQISRVYVSDAEPVLTVRRSQDCFSWRADDRRPPSQSTRRCQTDPKLCH